MEVVPDPCPPCSIKVEEVPTFINDRLHGESYGLNYGYFNKSTSGYQNNRSLFYDEQFATGELSREIRMGFYR